MLDVDFILPARTPGGLSLGILLPRRPRILGTTNSNNNNNNNNNDNNKTNDSNSNNSNI